TRKSGYGQTYFQPKDPNSQIKVMFLPSKRNLVMTSMADQQFAPVFRSDGKTIALNGQLAALAAKLRSNHVWAVANLDDAMRQQLLSSASAPMPGMRAVPGGGGAAMGELLKDCTALTAWASVQSGNLDIHFGLECSDAGVAQAKVT